MRAIIAGMLGALALASAAQAGSYAVVGETPSTLTAYDASTLRRHGKVVDFFELTAWSRPQRRGGVTADYSLSHKAVDCTLRKDKTDEIALYRQGDSGPVRRMAPTTFFQNIPLTPAAQREANLVCRLFPPTAGLDRTSAQELVTNYRANLGAARPADLPLSRTRPPFTGR